MTIPKTKEAAIAILVEMDVAKWGEPERAASERAHSARTLGLALNELANRIGPKADLYPRATEICTVPPEDMRRAARAALTPDDRAFLRRGG